MDNTVKNRYEHLRMQGFEDENPHNDYQVHSVFRSNVEIIDAYIAKITPELVVLGYGIWFKNGRNAIRKPSAENGIFRDEKDALLWFLGYIVAKKEYFSQDVLFDVKNQITELAQGSLF